MPIFKFVQEMMLVNVCVRFRDNWLRNEVCRAVTPFQVGRSPYWGGGVAGEGLHVTCEAHFQTCTRNVCEHICEVS